MNLLGEILAWGIGIGVVIIFFGVAVGHLPKSVKDWLYKKIFKREEK